MLNVIVFAGCLWGMIAFAVFMATADIIPTFGEAFAFALFWPLWLVRSIWRGFIQVWRQ